MSAAARGRLLALGVLWGALLAAVPAFAMADPYEPTGFLVAGLVVAALSGCAGTLAAARRALRTDVPKNGRREILAGLGTGLFQGLVGGGVAAFLIWLLMSVTLSGFSLDNPVEPSALMRPRVFLGSFFVSISVFVYALAGGLLLGPVFGTLINHTARAGAKGGA